MSFASTGSTNQRGKNKFLKFLAPLLAVLLLGGATPAALSYANPDETTPSATESATPSASAAPAPSDPGADGTNTPDPGDPSTDPSITSAPGDPSATSNPGDPSTPSNPGDPSSHPSATPTPAEGMDITPLLVDDPKLFLDGQELTPNADGRYIVHPDTPYQLRLHFAEQPDAENGQMPSAKDLVYTFPEGLQAYPDQKGTFTINTDKGSVEGNTFKVKDNALHVTLAKDTELEASQQAQFFASIAVKFAKDASDIPLTPDVTLKVTISNDPDLTITKTARHDFAAGKVFYTLVVKSIDTNENVEIADQISGEDSVLRLDTDPKSIKVTSTNKKAPKPGEPVFENNGFNLIIPKMTHNEQVTVTYSAFVDYSKIDPALGGTVEQTTNNANVLSDQIPAPKEATNNLASQLKIGTITKRAGSATEQAPKSGIYEQPWTLNVNQYSKLNVAGHSVTDTIPQEFQSIMKYSGDGIKIVVNKGKQDADGNSIEQTRTIAWKDLKNATEHTWTYQIPTDDPENSSYEITYTTQVDVNAQIVPSSVKNDASSDDGDPNTGPEKVTAPSSGLTPPHLFSVEKTVQKESVEEVSWQVVVNVVPQGYDSLVLEDTLPAAKSGDKSFQDVLKDTNIKVEGLLGGESYTFAKNTEKPESGFSLIFYKDAEKTKTGLQPLLDEDGNKVERQVKVTFTTKNDQEWVKAYRAGNNSLYRHVNKVKATANGIDRTASAAATPDPEGLTKTFNSVSTKEIDGVDYPVFNYQLRLEGLDKYTEDSFLVTDTFDATQLKLSDEPKPDISGVEKMQVKEEAGKVTFETKTADLPKDSDGNLRSVYYLHYSLIPSSREALDAINTNRDGLKVSNTATWGPVTTEKTEAEYLYSPLTKEMTEKPSSLNEYTATFKVTVNAGGLDIGEGLVLTDEMTNLRLQPETLEMTPAEFQYRPVYKDGSLTMQIPNRQKIEITYKAKVIGENLVNYSNKVKVGPEEVESKGSVAVRINAGGVAPNPGIRIHKHDASDLTTKLAGAEFELYRIIDGEAQPVVGKLTEDQAEAEPLRFITDETGEVAIRGDQGRLGWSLLVSNKDNEYVYELREVKAPEGYEILPEPLTFSITELPSEDTQLYDGAVLYVPNTPTPETPTPETSPTPSSSVTPDSKDGKNGKRLPKSGASGAVGIAAVVASIGIGSAFIFRRR